MPPAVDPIFDRAAYRRRLRRARAGPGADFLVTRAVADLCDRLTLARRSFRAAVDLGTPTPDLARALVEAGVPLVRMAPLAEPDAASWPTLVGDEEALPFKPEAFDLAVSALALHAANDLPGALVQMRRILRPDGLFLGCLVGGRSLAELREALAVAETECFGGVSPRVAPFADVRELGGLLQRAGFALPVADSETFTVRYPHLFALMADLRAMGATNILTARLRRPTPRRLFLRAAEIYAARAAHADGRIRATFELVFLSGWAPHESQRKPLRPGSATTRLADALAAARKDEEPT